MPSGSILAIVASLSRMTSYRPDPLTARAILLTVPVLLLAAVVFNVLFATLAAEAQPARPAPRIGFIGNADPKNQASSIAAFRQGLREAGLIEGRNVEIEYRWAEGKLDRFPVVAAELVRLNVDLIVATGTSSLRAVQQATSTIPIVTVVLVDPVDAGFVASHARPGGNITGLASQYEEIVTKQVQLLADAVPKLSRLILLRHASVGPETARAAAAAADTLGIKARVIEVTDVASFEGAFRAAQDERAQAMLVLPSPILNANRRTLIRLAATHRLPAFYEFRVYVEDGGLMSYGPSIEDMFRRVAGFARRILDGAKAGDLPMERPEKFELAINRKTAKALGLPLPQTLLIQADQLID
jgi:putative ABC transport system substrate-binding protein